MARLALVTGGTGFVGAAIVRELLRNGESVRVLRRVNSPLTNLHGLEVQHAIGDLAQPASLDAALNGVDRVYHCAALFALSGSLSRYIQANVIGTRNMLAACRRAGVERVVYTSTNAAVGSGRASTNEDQAWNFAPLQNAYITSKFLAEVEALRFAATGLPVVIVNPGAPLGPGDVRPTPTGAMIRNLLRGWYPLLLPVALPLVDVDDCARHHRLAMEKGRPGERYISVSQTLTLVEVHRILREEAGAPWRPWLPRLAMKAAVASTWLLPQFLGPLTAVARYALHGLEYDNSKSRQELDMEFKPVREALRMQAQWLKGRE